MSASLSPVEASLALPEFGERLQQAFLRFSPLLAEMPKRDGWNGAGEFIVPVHGELVHRRRGVGYAMVAFHGETLFAMRNDLTNLGILVRGRLLRAAEELGRAVHGALTTITIAGDQDVNLESIGEAEDAALASPLGIGVSVQRVAMAFPGDTFHHLEALPHLVNDDGNHILRAGKADALLMRLRFFGNTVPAASE